MSAPARKTYSHLERARRAPSDYEIGTTKLHYYVERGFEVDVPLKEWFAKYQSGSPLRVPDWDGFVDPRETTYTKYVALQAAKEQYVETLHRSIAEQGFDQTLSPDWVAKLEHYWSPFRYAGHGLQMVAAYVGQMAPSGKITAACALQAADEMRRVQCIAYRTALLRRTWPGFGAAARDDWQRDEAWQPMRELVERLLVTFDWAEAFTALNLCVKPVVDAFFLEDLPDVARRSGDPMFGAIAFSLNEDCRWHRDWSKALVALALRERAENAEVLARWVDVWLPRAEAAVAALGRAVEGGSVERGPCSSARGWLRSLGAVA